MAFLVAVQQVYTMHDFLAFRARMQKTVQEPLHSRNAQGTRRMQACYGCECFEQTLHLAWVAKKTQACGVTHDALDTSQEHVKLKL